MSNILKLLFTHLKRHQIITNFCFQFSTDYDILNSVIHQTLILLYANLSLVFV